MSNRIQNKHKCINHLHHVAVKRDSLPDVVKRLAKLEKLTDKIYAKLMAQEDAA